MSNHTPAPWFIGESMRTGQHCIIGDGDSVVAFMPDPLVDCTYKPADAALIASAPELLDVVERLLEVFGGDEYEHFGSIQTARRVLAKATGEQP